jgi:hypothetical protein
MFDQKNQAHVYWEQIFGTAKAQNGVRWLWYYNNLPDKKAHLKSIVETYTYTWFLYQT